MGTALLPNNVSVLHLAFSKDEVTKSHEEPENVGGQGRLAMRHVNLGRHLN